MTRKKIIRFTVNSILNHCLKLNLDLKSKHKIYELSDYLLSFASLLREYSNLDDTLHLD